LSKQAQRKKLGKKEMPFTRGTRPEPPRPFLKKSSIKKQNWALPEPARFFEKKRGQKTKLGAARTHDPPPKVEAPHPPPAALGLEPREPFGKAPPKTNRVLREKLRRGRLAFEKNACTRRTNML